MLLTELCHDCLVYFVIKYCQLLFQSNFLLAYWLPQRKRIFCAMELNKPIRNYLCMTKLFCCPVNMPPGDKHHKLQKWILKNCTMLTSFQKPTIAIHFKPFKSFFFIRAYILHLLFFIPSFNVLSGCRSGYVSISLVAVTTAVSCVAVVCVSFEPRGRNETPSA